MRDSHARAHFLREAQAAALNHLNICTVYEIGEADGQTSVVMALIEGGSLRDRIACGPLTTCIEIRDLYTTQSRIT